MFTVIVGDLIELTGKKHDSDDAKVLKNLESIPWDIQEDSPVPVEIFSLYYLILELTISDVNFDVFNQMKKSEFSPVFVHVDKYEEMFILFFEFAIEIRVNEF